METLSKDIYFTLAKDMEIRDLIDFCIADKRANEKICKNDDVWRYRLEKEFPDWRDFKLEKSLLNTYVFLYQLKILKEEIKFKGKYLSVIHFTRTSFSWSVKRIT